MRLSQCRECARVRVVGVSAVAPGAPAALELGLRPGAIVRVLQRGAFGAVVVALDGARVMLDAATAHRTGVVPLVAAHR